MHNRARETREQLDVRKASNVQKVEKYSKLNKMVMENHQIKNYDAESFALSAKLLELNPEIGTVWNYRRLSLMHLHSTRSSSPAPAPAPCALLDAELALVERALHKNPKSYGAWHHRKWVVAQGQSDLQRELVLCGRLLDLDCRNFHCWSYRRYVASLASRSLEEELEFTTHKIEQNFSNYSAWHLRTRLLPQLHSSASSPLDPALQQSPQLAETSDSDNPICRPVGLVKHPPMYPSPPCPSSHLPIPSASVLPHPTTPINTSATSAFNCKIHSTTIASSSPSTSITSLTTSASTSTSASTRPLASSSSSSTILPTTTSLCPSSPSSLPVEVVAREAELVKQAFFTEPADQSAWLYHRWLMAHLPTTDGDGGASAQAVLEGEVNSVRELLELEPDSKWAMLTLARMLEAIREGSLSDNGDEETNKRERELVDLYSKLIVKDTCRNKYFRDKLISLVTKVS
eukprot:CAMPEP_0196584788 /NCGR_PEP_ID=MMETSP1081-20130531/48475_1 /TAXON_ID=36882 /ORGANISM="Pyramimonas amylifera, Strain CCMP720" /LENGTH=459 /DNA_ID=CAMNT_0041906131 /DNA_START=56 /DNA_END=1435 /DNA_ORIENTATION=+